LNILLTVRRESPSNICSTLGKFYLKSAMLLSLLILEATIRCEEHQILLSGLLWVLRQALRWLHCTCYVHQLMSSSCIIPAVSFSYSELIQEWPTAALLLTWYRLDVIPNRVVGIFPFNIASIWCVNKETIYNRCSTCYPWSWVLFTNRQVL
jgi:hypothetical protein